jgi:hypothetical protein
VVRLHAQIDSPGNVPAVVPPPSPISAQDRERLQTMEDSLLITADSMFTAFIPDTRIAYSERFARQLVRALRITNSFYYNFPKLGKLVNIIAPDDNSFRIFNWEIAPDLVSKRYYGAIQMPAEQLKLYGLNDYSQELGKYAEDSVLTGGKWFGALYYRIITHEVAGQKVYTLFGLNAGGPISSKKVLDPLMFTADGVVFGAAIFAVASEANPQQRINRFILEYKKGVQVALNWDDQLNMIYFDKLVSQTEDPRRKYTYVPSGEYDGMRWENDNWRYVQNLIPVQALKDGEAPGGATDPVH